METTIENTKMKPVSELECPNCGSPLKSSVCEYCGTYVENADIGTEDTYFFHSAQAAHDGAGMLFVMGFLFLVIFFITAVVFMVTPDGKLPLPFMIMGVPIFATFVGSVFWQGLRGHIIFNSTMKKGKVLNGKVVGYTMNGGEELVTGQKVKILTQVNGKDCYIAVPTRGNDKPYPLHSLVAVMIYKKHALVLKKSTRM